MPGRDRHSPDGPRCTRRSFLAGSAASLLPGCGRRPPDPESLPRDVLALHRDSLVFDLHLDTLVWQRIVGYDPVRRHEPIFPRSGYGWHFDLPRVEEGGLDGAVLGLVVTPDEERPEQPLGLRLLSRLEPGSGIDQTLETLELLDATAGANPARLEFALSGSQLRRAMEAGRFAALAGLEGAHGIGSDLANVRRAWQHGLRMIGLVHFQASAAAHPMTVPDFAGRGLTPFGFDLIAEMDALPMVVDLAHLNAAGVDDALAAMTRPFVVSHTACRALHDHPRNLEDEQIRRIAGRGGVIGLAAGRDFLGAGGLDAFAAHAEHVVKLGGAHAVALGSDWDGGIVPVPGLEDVRGLPFLSAHLLERGWTEDALRGLLGQNALSALTDALG